ncbi:uncharacterized protein VP01_5506g1 [Puccinia sorghi]|uniref:Uncharacterized protein n=1 Tax=Puccinia sorghi TaxID=27349 RepID=A0A0L6UK41_9BASI|nr:uncharacterized protein VP01_5506g1 [Puccinia sorghi]
MSRPCPCAACFNKFKGNGPHVTQRTILNHLNKEKITPQMPSTSELIQIYSKNPSEVKQESSMTGPGMPDNTCNWTFLSLVLVAYLHVIAGLSIKEANTTLVTIKMILEGFNIDPNTIQQRKIKFPMDIRTAISLLSIEPVIYQTLCCPSCFRLYNLNEHTICQFVNLDTLQRVKCAIPHCLVLMAAPSNNTQLKASKDGYIFSLIKKAQKLSWQPL